MPPADSMVGWTVRSGASASFQPLTGAFAALVGAGDDFAPLRGDMEVAALLFRLQAANSNQLGHLCVLLRHTRALRRTLERATGDQGAAAAAPEAAGRTGAGRPAPGQPAGRR